MEEITAEYASNTLTAPPELKVKTKVSVGCKTDLGRVRENNEDNFEYFVPDDESTLASKGMAFVVCDGKRFVRGGSKIWQGNQQNNAAGGHRTDHCG